MELFIGQAPKDIIVADQTEAASVGDPEGMYNSKKVCSALVASLSLRLYFCRRDFGHVFS